MRRLLINFFNNKIILNSFSIDKKEHYFFNDKVDKDRFLKFFFAFLI